jgi:hypothetical protein
MKRSYALCWIAGLALGLIAAPVRAQTTAQRAVDVLNRPQTGPVVEPGRTTTTTRTTRTTVIVPQREVIVVERVHARRGWWNRSQYRAITVYYDGSGFYRRPFDRRMLRKVVVYQRAGRYYIDEEQWRQDRRRQWGHDDKWKDDDNRHDDDKWKDDDHKDKSNGNNGRHLGQDPDKHEDNH